MATARWGEAGDLEGVYRGQWRSEEERWLKGRVCHVTEPLSKTSRVRKGAKTQVGVSRLDKC